eukprot:10714858-Alexandrium_andersonii.AAC.1
MPQHGRGRQSEGVRREIRQPGRLGGRWKRRCVRKREEAGCGRKRVQGPSWRVWRGVDGDNEGDDDGAPAAECEPGA